MGIYDRDYYRDEPRRSLMGNWSAVTILIVVNVVIFVLDQFMDQARLTANIGWTPTWHLLARSCLPTPGNSGHC